MSNANVYVRRHTQILIVDFNIPDAFRSIREFAFSMSAPPDDLQVSCAQSICRKWEFVDRLLLQGGNDEPGCEDRDGPP
jgi:hypothetical protein